MFKSFDCDTKTGTSQLKERKSETTFSRRNKTTRLHKYCHSFRRCATASWDRVHLCPRACTHACVTGLCAFQTVSRRSNSGALKIHQTCPSVPAAYPCFRRTLLARAPWSPRAAPHAVIMAVGSVGRSVKAARATQASKKRRRHSPSLPALAAWWTPAWKVGQRDGSGRKSAGFFPPLAVTCVGPSCNLLTPNVAVRLAAERCTVNKLRPAAHSSPSSSRPGAVQRKRTVLLFSSSVWMNCNDKVEKRS